MDILFYLAAAVAVISTVLVITRANAVHAMLYLILSLLAVAVIFFVLGAPFAAVLEVIIYAGAIMVLFVFVIMMINLGPQSAAQERTWLSAGAWVPAGILGAVLLGEVLYILLKVAPSGQSPGGVSPKLVGIALYGPYVLAVELASMLLLAGLVGAYHLGRGRQGQGASQP